MSSQQLYHGDTEVSRKEQQPAMDHVPDALATAIAREMGNILVRQPLGLMDDFFLAGGDSSRAVELITRLVERCALGDAEATDQLHAALTLAMFDNASPAAIAEAIAKQTIERS
ncbi:hypothetical protein ABGB16_11825 [Micromonospora sp. B11E3]|uniref:hypothetical protein n=1 Tax=Micromonospora sp. B11E3 TaxID=3153562 RepID=UPI00325D0E2B